MADNTILLPGSGGDTIRDIDRGGVKTQIVALDLHPGGVETLTTGNIPVGQAGTWNIDTVTTVGKVTLITTLDTVGSLTAFNGNAIDTNSGNKGVGTLRVVLATDQPALANALLVDTELPAAAALSDAAANPTAPLIGACELVWNGTTWDRKGGVVAATGLVSAARTTAQSFSITNTGAWRNLFIFLNVTAASGTGGLTVQINTGDPISGNLAQLNANPTAVTGTGLKVYEIGSDMSGTASGGITQSTTRSLPRSLTIGVAVGDASSYTYSVGYVLTP